MGACHTEIEIVRQRQAGPVKGSRDCGKSLIDLRSPRDQRYARFIDRNRRLCLFALTPRVDREFIRHGVSAERGYFEPAPHNAGARAVLVCALPDDQCAPIVRIKRDRRADL